MAGWDLQLHVLEVQRVAWGNADPMASPQRRQSFLFGILLPKHHHPSETKVKESEITCSAKLSGHGICPPKSKITFPGVLLQLQAFPTWSKPFWLQKTSGRGRAPAGHGGWHAALAHLPGGCGAAAEEPGRVQATGAAAG